MNASSNILIPTGMIELIPLKSLEKEEGVYDINRAAKPKHIQPVDLGAYNRKEGKLRWVGQVFPVPIYYRGSELYVATEV